MPFFPNDFFLLREGINTVSVPRLKWKAFIYWLELIYTQNLYSKLLEKNKQICCHFWNDFVRNSQRTIIIMSNNNNKSREKREIFFGCSINSIQFFILFFVADGEYVMQIKLMRWVNIYESSFFSVLYEFILNDKLGTIWKYINGSKEHHQKNFFFLQILASYVNT